MKLILSQDSIARVPSGKLPGRKVAQTKKGDRESVEEKSISSTQVFRLFGHFWPLKASICLAKYAILKE